MTAAQKTTGVKFSISVLAGEWNLDTRRHTDQLLSLYKTFEEVNFTCIFCQDLSSRFTGKDKYSALQIYTWIDFIYSSEMNYSLVCEKDLRGHTLDSFSTPPTCLPRHQHTWTTGKYCDLINHHTDITATSQYAWALEADKWSYISFMQSWKKYLEWITIMIMDRMEDIRQHFLSGTASKLNCSNHPSNIRSQIPSSVYRFLSSQHHHWSAKYIESLSSGEVNVCGSKEKQSNLQSRGSGTCALPDLDVLMWHGEHMILYGFL